MRTSTAIFILFVLSLPFLLAACAEPSVMCNAPYIKVGSECCLDDDANGVCDRDEGNAPAQLAECPALDCSKCPARVVERNTTVTETKYVCLDGTTADTPAACTKKAQNPFDGYGLVTSDDPSILSFTARPACRGSYKGVELNYHIGTASPEITVQLKESPNGEWRDVYTYTDGAMSKYIYGTFCPRPFCTVSDFYFDVGKSYVARLKFDYRSLRGVYEFSDEVLIDGSDGGPYTTKLC